MTNQWHFRTIHSIEEPVFNPTLERFYKLGIDGLVRENIQNSLDGKLPNSSEPVHVIIETGTIRSSNIPGISEIKERIACLRGGNEYTKESIDNMHNNKDADIVNYITFEDQNTKGLTGASHGEQGTENDSWAVYAYKKGVHFEDQNRSFENSRGGSHGVGKIASNAASNLNVMFFANCDEHGNQHIGGSIQLIEHQLNNQCYRASGYFTNVDLNNYFIPFENNFSSVFKKETRGLKIIIPYLRNDYNDTNKIIRSVCDNFFLAILHNALIVTVNDISISCDTLEDIVLSSEAYRTLNQDNNNLTKLYINTYKNIKPLEIEIEDQKNSYKFDLYLYYNDEIKKGKIAIIRNIGMKIEDKTIKNYSSAPINGVLIPRSESEDLFLKSLENEAHNQLSFEHIKNDSKKKNARRFINNISRTIGEIIAILLREKNPSDGRIDTSELIYTSEKNFTKDLTKHTSTVKLTKGNSSSEKTIVKVKTTKQKKDKNKKEKEKKHSLKEKIKQLLKQDGNEGNRQRVRYLMHPDTVQRIALSKKEILHFDFSKTEQYENETKCNISMVLIDGEGKEHPNEFQIIKNYSTIIDKSSNRECKVENNIINDINIVNGIIDLELHYTELFNRYLKFVYYVEV